MSVNGRDITFREDDFERFNPMEWVEPILKHRWVVAFIVLTSLLCGMLYNFKATPIYHAKSSLVIKQNTSSSVIRERETELSSKRRWLSQNDINTKINIFI